MALEMKSIHSSHINEGGYDPDTQELHIQYDKGKYSVYKNVPPDVASDVLNAWSVGQMLHRIVKGRYDHEYR